MYMDRQVTVSAHLPSLEADRWMKADRRHPRYEARVYIKNQI